MLGSFDEAEDLVQETLLRAWRSRDSLRDESGLRAWLDKIATNACMDAIKASKRRVPRADSFAEVPWLQPYPDRMLDEIAPPEDEPDAVVVARETIELTYLAVLQRLPPRQRAVVSCATCSSGRRARPPGRSRCRSRPPTARCSSPVRCSTSAGSRPTT
jgi:RNA polymerase sigma-70 factor (ECF subfamily)